MLNNDYREQINLPEYGKFNRIDNDSNFPAISVIRTRTPDTSQAYNNGGTNIQTLTSVDIYPKYAILTYQVGSSINTSLTSTQTLNVTVSATEGQINPANTNITQLTGSGNFSKMWIYPVSSFSSGIPGPNVSNVYIGKSGNAATKFLPDILTPSSGPILIQLPNGQQMPVGQVIIKIATVGDGIFYSWT